MKITVTQEQGRVPVTILHLDGELTGDSSEQLTGQAQQVIAGGAQYLLLDMTSVPYMSSAGIRAVHQIFNWLRELPGGEDEAALKTVVRDGKYKSRRLKLLNTTPQVQKTLATSGVDMFVETHRDPAQALASF